MSKLLIWVGALIATPPVVAGIYFFVWCLLTPFGRPLPVFHWPSFWITIGLIAFVAGLIAIHIGIDGEKS